MSSVIALWRSVRPAIKWQVLRGDHEYTVLSLASMLQLYLTYMRNTFQKKSCKTLSLHLTEYSTRHKLLGTNFNQGGELEAQSTMAKIPT